MELGPESESVHKFIPPRMSFAEYHQNRADKAKKIIKILRAKMGSLQDLTVLDIGCHDGGLTYNFSGEFKYVVGVDNDVEAVSIAEDVFKADNLVFMVVEDGSALPFEENSFDVIISNHVFYYVKNKELFVSEIFRLLKPEGRCYLSVTNGLYTDLIRGLPGFIKKPFAGFLLGSSENFGNPLRYGQYVSYFSGGRVADMTYEIFKGYEKYSGDFTGFKKLVLRVLSSTPSGLLRLFSKLSPTFIFVLLKKESITTK